GEHHVIQPHVVDVEGDVLLRLPLDRLRELLLGHRRELDLLDDDGVPGERGGVVGALDLGLVVELVDGVDGERRVHDRPVDDRLGRQGLDAQALEVELPGLAFPKLDELDRRAADVETHDSLRAREEHGVYSSSESPVFNAGYWLLLKASLEASGKK